MARMFFGWPRGGGDGWGGTRESKAGGKVSVSGAVPGFASLGVQIFGNGRWGGAGRDDGLALGSLVINGLGYLLDGIELAEDRIFRYFYVGLTANRNRAHGLTRYASMVVTTEGE